MKLCPNCQTEVNDEAKFCPSCGHALEEQWYYVLGKEQYGPLTRAEMLELFSQERLNLQSLVRLGQQGQWVLYEASGLYEPKQPDRTWYYMSEGQQLGPYSEQEIADLIKLSKIDATTLLFCQGDDKWVYLTKTKFFVEEPQPQPQPQPVHHPLYEKQSIGLSIFLSIITCGIYYLIWLYRVSQYTNILLKEKNGMSLTDPAMVVLLSIFTCGLYSLYWFWLVPSHLAGIEKPDGSRINDSSLLCVLLSFFGLGVVSLAMIQSELNAFA